ncbi:FtsK/SpoIIIE domain-containing protein [Brevibacterium aurantiacum]|nr:FtsK/SpoIIIE domain-containing protein [Brevibacterium aurantiacum]
MTLLVGGTGSGKGSVIWSLLLGLAPAIRAGVVRVHGIDLKGGVEFTTGVDLFHQVAYTYAEAKDLLAGLEDALEQRLAHMVESGSRKHVPSADHPLELLVVDEAASLTYLAPDTATSKKVDAHLKRILSTGRAAGFSVLAAMQDPRKESLSTRDLFSNQIALRLRTEDDARLALGAWAVDAGAQAHMIPETQQGTGYGIDSETSEIVRFRAFWCSDDAVRGVAAEVTLSFMEGADDEF